MWFYLEQEELDVIIEALKHSNLHGLNFLIKSQFAERSPVNPKHTKEKAAEAAKTYFSASDLEMDTYVRWDENGDAKVMAWQHVPKEYILEDCGCGKK